MNISQYPTPLAADSAGPQYYDVRQAAQILKCSVRTVYRYMKSGRLGYSQEVKGGVIRISPDDIAAYYEVSRIGPSIPRRRTRLAA